jgi:hypothetical protein
MSFWCALLELMLGDSGRIANEYHGYGILVFSAACGLMGFIAVLLDRVVFSVRQRSFFNLSYGNGLGSTARLLCLWGIGAGVGGFLGSAGSIVQLTRAASIGVGVGWPFILPRLIDSFTDEEDQQSPEDGQ